MFVERGCRGLLHSARFPSGANTLKAYPFTPLNPCKPPKTPSGTVTIRFEAPTEDNPSLTSASLLFLHPTILSFFLSLFFSSFSFHFYFSFSSSVNRQFSLSNSAYSQGGGSNPFRHEHVSHNFSTRRTKLHGRSVHDVSTPFSFLCPPPLSFSLSLVCSLYPLSHLSFEDPSFLSFNPRETVAV